MSKVNRSVSVTYRQNPTASTSLGGFSPVSANSSPTSRPRVRASSWTLDSVLPTLRTASCSRTKPSSSPGTNTWPANGRPTPRISAERFACRWTVIDIDDCHEDTAQETAGCRAFNWVEEFQSCLLLSDYSRRRTREGVTAGYCAQSCPPQTSPENVVFKFNKDTLISREEMDTFNDCYGACKEVSPA